jgi:leucyl aminopeptidase
MQFPVKTGAPATLKTACAIVPLFEDELLTGVGKKLDKACGGVIRRLLDSREAPVKAGRTLMARTVRGPAEACFSSVAASAHSSATSNSPTR